MAVDVIRTIASRGFRMRGSGTRSTRTSLVPCHTTAFMQASDHRSPLVRPRSGSIAVRLTFGGGNLAGFEQVFEAAEIFADRLRWLLTKHPRDRGAQFAGRRAVLEAYVDARATVRAVSDEPDRSGTDHVRAVEGAPADQLVR